MNRYLLLIRQDDFDPSQYTPESMENIFKSVEDWMGQLSADNILVDTAPLLMQSAKTVRQKNDRLTVDGPYTESAEVIAGFYIIQAADQKSAVEISKACPQLKIGSSVEVIEMGRLRHGCID